MDYATPLCIVHAYYAWAQLNHTPNSVTHLFHAGQGGLNEPRPSTVLSGHTSQTKQTLGVKRAQAQFR